LFTLSLFFKIFDYIKSIGESSKLHNVAKMSLEVKPPIKIMVFRHNVIFSKTVVLGGGVTLVPRYKMQTLNHQDLPAKHI